MCMKFRKVKCEDSICPRVIGENKCRVCGKIPTEIYGVVNCKNCEDDK